MLLVSDLLNDAAQLIQERGWGSRSHLGSADGERASTAICEAVKQKGLDFDVASELHKVFADFFFGTFGIIIPFPDDSESRLSFSLCIGKSSNREIARSSRSKL